MKEVTIGNSTLYCGDCFDILPKLGTIADAVISDPPFGITSCDWDRVLPLKHLWELFNSRTKASANFVLFACGKFMVDLINSKYRWYRYDLVWQKNNKVGFLNANLMPMRGHEQILVFGRNGYQKQSTYNPQKIPDTQRKGARIVNRKNSVYKSVGNYVYVCDGSSHPCSVLPFDHDRVNKPLHSTQKPVALMEFLVKSYSNENDLILDPFMGSGTTGAACTKTGRRFIGIEKDEAYFDIACRRIESINTTVHREGNAVGMRAG